MKNLIFFAILLIFILNISDNVISAEAKDEVPDPVLDLDGNELKTGISAYYIAPVFRPGGGVTIYPIANKTCAFWVVKDLPGVDALPVMFFSSGTDQGVVVRESTDTAIAFLTPIFCLPVWKVDEYDEAAQQYFITADVGRDGNETSINRWFQIRKNPSSDGSYRFVFCPKVCEFCAQICTDVGIIIYEGIGRFALDGNLPFSFGFKKSSP